MILQVIREYDEQAKAHPWGDTLLDLAEEQGMAHHAAEYAMRAFGNKARHNPEEPYWRHTLRVAGITRRLLHAQAEETTAVALLHDVLEKTEVSAEDLEKEFGPAVCEAVVALSKPTEGPAAEREERYEAQILEGSAEVKLVKLADLIDNLAMRHLHGDERESMTRARRYNEALSKLSLDLPVSVGRFILLRLIEEIDEEDEEEDAAAARASPPKATSVRQ